MFVKRLVGADDSVHPDVNGIAFLRADRVVRPYEI